MYIVLVVAALLLSGAPLHAQAMLAALPVSMPFQPAAELSAAPRLTATAVLHAAKTIDMAAPSRRSASKPVGIPVEPAISSVSRSVHDHAPNAP